MRSSDASESLPAAVIAGDAPLRVLHVDAAREWRGGQNQVRLLAGRLRGRAGVEQAVAGRAGSRLLAEAAELGVATVPLPWRPALDPRAVAGLAREAGDWDLLHAHNSHALQAGILALAASGAPSRLVASRRSAFEFSSSRTWRRADLVLAVSGAVRRVALRSGLEPARVRVVHSGVEPEAVTPAGPGVLREVTGASDGDLLVGAAGALDASKDHRTLVRAAARVARQRAGVRFVVAGEGPLRERLEGEVRDRGLEGRFALPGHLPELGRSLGDLDLFVMCSRQEGFGSAALEAMAAGVATVVTRAGGLVEMAGDAVPTVPPGDPEALAAEILRLLDDGDERRRVAERGRRRVHERFTAAHTADATLAAYREVEASRLRRLEYRRRLERRGRVRRALPIAGGRDAAARREGGGRR